MKTLSADERTEWEKRTAHIRKLFPDLTWSDPRQKHDEPRYLAEARERAMEALK